LFFIVGNIQIFLYMCQKVGTQGGFATGTEPTVG
jgi:hypothetical protein